MLNKKTMSQYFYTGILGFFLTLTSYISWEVSNDTESFFMSMGLLNLIILPMIHFYLLGRFKSYKGQWKNEEDKGEKKKNNGRDINITVSLDGNNKKDKKRK